MLADYVAVEGAVACHGGRSEAYEQSSARIT